MAEKGKAKKVEKEFLQSFMQQLAIAKEKIVEEKVRKKRELKAEEKIARLGKKLRPSIMKPEKARIRKELAPLTIEAEKVKEKPKIKKVSEVEAEAPIYKRKLPSLPKPPKVTEEWPLPPPRPPARPPEEEAEAAPMVPELTPAPAPPAAPSSPKEEKPPAMVALDLGKLNPFIADPSVKLIQCDGANKKIKITKEGTIQETDSILSEDEIKAIIKKFGDRAGLALTEPIFRATVSNLSITAVISAFTGYKFFISKI